MLDKSWTDKINRARKVEKEILLWYRETYNDPTAHLTEGYNSDYDIVGKEHSVEVKEDRMAHQTGYYALEYRTHDDKPSGYMGTKADIFCIVDWQYVLFVDTHMLREIIDSMTTKKAVRMGQKFPDGRTNQGWLIPREKLLVNPLITVKERWFPVGK